MSNTFIKDYFKTYKKLLDLEPELINQLKDIKKIFTNTYDKNKIMLFGNGASASIASHTAVDLTKVGGLRATAYNDATLLTCFSNDYNYNNWIKEVISHYYKPKDVIVFISSSGESMNIVRGAHYAKDKNMPVITLSGMDKNNRLKKLGKINLYVESKAYNLIENCHQFYLSCVVDMIKGKMVYSS